MHYCQICDAKQSRGIYIFHVYVCESCQEKLVTTDPEDPNYRYFVHKLRRIRHSPMHS